MRIAWVLCLVIAGLMTADFVVVREAVAQSFQTRLLFQSNRSFRSGSFTQRPAVQRQQLRVERQRLSSQRQAQAQARARQTTAAAIARARQAAVSSVQAAASARQAAVSRGGGASHTRPPAAIPTRALPAAKVAELKAGIAALPLKPPVAAKPVAKAAPSKPPLVPARSAKATAKLTGAQVAAAVSAGRSRKASAVGGGVRIDGRTSTAALKGSGTGGREPPDSSTRTEANDNIKFQKVIVDSMPKSVDWKVSSGVRINADPDKTTTILGSYSIDMRHVISKLSYPKTYDFGPKKGGFNVLNTPDNAHRDSEQFWKQHNRPFLEAAIKRGDRIILATTPNERANLSRFNAETGQMERTGFGREIDLLIENGYLYDTNSGAMVRR